MNLKIRYNKSKSGSRWLLATSPHTTHRAGPQWATSRLQVKIVSSRNNFFGYNNFEQEINQYFNLNTGSYLHYQLREFTEEQASELFKMYGSSLSDSLPNLKPLLISKIAIKSVTNGGNKVEYSDITDYIINREYEGHLARANQRKITKEQFYQILYEVASYTMTQQSYSCEISDKILTDIYSNVVGFNPEHDMYSDLKKLMIFQINENNFVFMYDGFVVNSLVVKLIEKISRNLYRKLEIEK